MTNIAALSLTHAKCLVWCDTAFGKPGMDSGHGLCLTDLPQQLEGEPSNEPSSGEFQT